MSFFPAAADADMCWSHCREDGDVAMTEQAAGGSGSAYEQPNTSSKNTPNTVKCTETIS